MENSYHYVRGYAAPFLQVQKAHGRHEFFDPQAFDQMLTASEEQQPVFLNFGDHDEPPICSGVTLFTDDYGLGFTAAIPAESWRAIKPYIVGNCQYASVNVTDEKSQPDRDSDGGYCRRIISATIDHITLCANPVYIGTGVWPRDVVGAMPPRLARLA